MARLNTRRIIRELNNFYEVATGVRCHSSASGLQFAEDTKDEQFRTLDFGAQKRRTQSVKKKVTNKILPPSYKRQKIDQNWGNVWPTARTFQPATVPLPVRQGYPAKNQAVPDKWGNAELMKIPNFLHLTPPVIEQQCKALKKFCTPWPEGLETKEDEEQHFPLTVITSTYLHSSPTIRDPRARIVTFKVKLSSLDLNDHGVDKLLRLVGDRYDPETDMLTLVTDRCPLSRQNYDYSRYLLSVLYSEAKKIEPWEHEKSLEDQEKYTWEGSPSEQNLNTIIEASKESVPPQYINEYSDVVTAIHNEDPEAF
ncbi:mitochondrial ribosomal protein S35 isoform X2 [Oratosquilla oratoria]|uniref:mitochondrial ribosomal protein S35 isoform X2 n=1 Tax=Oratosquilla oratoria TaxID=337810 RepID=UPI003F759CC2